MRIAAPVLASCFAACSPGEFRADDPAEFHPAWVHYEGRTVVFYDDAGAEIARREFARAVDSVLAFNDRYLLLKLMSEEGRPDGVLRVAELPDGPESALEQPRVRSAAIAPEGATALLVAWDRTLLGWEVGSAEPLEVAPVAAPYTVFFSPTGRRAAFETEIVSEREATDVFVYDVERDGVEVVTASGRALQPRWLDAATLVFREIDAGGVEVAWRYDLSTGDRTQVEPQIHAAAVAAARRISGGPGSEGPPAAAGVRRLALDSPWAVAMPFPAGESWYVSTGYNTSPTHVGRNAYAIDFALSGCSGWAQEHLSILDGTVLSVGGPASNTCGSPCGGPCDSSDCTNSGGLVVQVDHGSDYVTSYLHSSATHVTAGDFACRGRWVADQGNSGWSCGCACPDHPGTHLHIRMTHGDDPVKMEPMSGHTGIVAGQTLTSDNAPSDCMAAPSCDGGEVCDGLDNDCDGATDEDGVCVPPCEPSAEVCNGEDDDCDGSVDEDAGCAPTCVPTAEVCDGADNDCDGLTDEGGVCDMPCAPSTEVCNGLDDDCDGLADEGGVCCTPSTEVCDGADNDCDGAVDEGGVCCTPYPEVCNGGDDDCDGAVDEGGVCGCVPTTETCNGVDDDCDGYVDEGGVCCTPSTEVCDGADNDCDGAIDEGGVCCTPSTEVCDGVDNDCDGSVDEGGVCGCTPDGYEPNNGSPSATPIADGATLCASICAGDADWFGFGVGSGVYVSVWFAGAAGDVDLEVYSGLTGWYVAGSYGTGDSESITLDGLAAGTYWARVYGYTPTTENSYCIYVDTW